MRSWDIFCSVIDNYGDVGVCWRLARQLARERGARVRLWVDGLASLCRLAPEIDVEREQQTCQGVLVRRWQEPFPDVDPAQVVIEAFACDPPPGYVAAMARMARKPAWINLEYLSAERWVEGCHKLPSPHPRLPLVKHFFFPGFSPGTGGLLREAALTRERENFLASSEARRGFWRRIGLREPHAGEMQVSLFCYPQPVVGALLEAWSGGDGSVRCLVPEGTVERELAAYFSSGPVGTGTCLRKGALEACVVPFVDQEAYDRLLWACDFNVVRGEDSFVRAQWAARPFLWHIYPQDAGAHWPKLEAFLAQYCAPLEPGLARSVKDFWDAWNRGAGSAIPALWREHWAASGELRTHARAWATDLEGQADLANQLADFVENLLK